MRLHWVTFRQGFWINRTELNNEHVDWGPVTAQQ